MVSVVQLIPIGKLLKIGDLSTYWKAIDGGDCFLLDMPGNVYPSGWTLVQCSLKRHGAYYNARLHYDLGEGYTDALYFEIPASGKGEINELICLPPGIKHMKFSPMGTAGVFEIGSLTFTKVGTLKRIWHMMHRIVAMIYRHSKQKRKVINLTLPRMLMNLQDAYTKAGKLLPQATAPQYQDWIEQFDELKAEDRAQINQHFSSFERPPYFHLLIMSNGAESAAIQKTLDSLDKQLYRNFSCLVVDTSELASQPSAETPYNSLKTAFLSQIHQAEWLEQFDATLNNCNGEKWMMLVRAGDVLAPHGLYRFSCEVLAHPESAVVYSDDDMLNANGERCEPRFKPDWSLVHFRSTNFVGDAVVFRGSAVAAAGGVSLECCQFGNYDLLLRMVDTSNIESTKMVVHIPAVLVHRMERPDNLSDTINDEMTSQWQLKALHAHLLRNRVSAKVSKTLPDCWRVRYKLPEVPPLVSIIVPTRDALAMLQQCLESLLAKTTYPRFEILVVDNQSADPEALAYLEQITLHEKLRVLRYDQPFNYSAINNMAVGEAQGEVVCLLNNDTEVLSPDWLEDMVGHLLQPKVGVVGAKLYFPNGEVQHGGDLVGVGNVANHAHAYLQHDDPGYCNRAVVAQELSAVTGACLMTWKSLYTKLGGLDEKHLKVSFNDVDYCLRVREADYRVVWTPHAELYHHESVSRGKDLSPEKKKRAKREVSYMRKRWKHVLKNDPFYNPNLSYERPDFSLSHAPMIDRPWRK